VIERQGMHLQGLAGSHKPCVELHERAVLSQHTQAATSDTASKETPCDWAQGWRRWIGGRGWVGWVNVVIFETSLLTAGPRKRDRARGAVQRCVWCVKSAIATAMRTACDCVVCVEQRVAISHASDVQPRRLVTRTHTHTQTNKHTHSFGTGRRTHMQVIEFDAKSTACDAEHDVPMRGVGPA
jgi:hypothetical protein